MCTPTPPLRWSSRSGIDGAIRALGLDPSIGKQQDWWVFAADAERVSEFCDVYDRVDVDDEVKFALMEVIIESVNDALPFDVDDALLNRLNGLLVRDFVLNFHSFAYWALLNEIDPNNLLEVTPLIRDVWSRCFKAEYLPWLAEETDNDPLVASETGFQ